MSLKSMLEIRYDTVSVEIQRTVKVNFTFILLHVISSEEIMLFNYAKSVEIFLMLYFNSGK